MESLKSQGKALGCWWWVKAKIGELLGLKMEALKWKAILRGARDDTINDWTFVGWRLFFQTDI